jgi:hypothetical protein
MKWLLLVFLLFSGCSQYNRYGTHPAEYDAVDFALNEIHTVIKYGRIDPEIGNRTSSRAFEIFRNEYWRTRMEQALYGR